MSHLPADRNDMVEVNPTTNVNLGKRGPVSIIVDVDLAEGWSKECLNHLATITRGGDEILVVGQPDSPASRWVTTLSRTRIVAPPSDAPAGFAGAMDRAAPARMAALHEIVVFVGTGIIGAPSWLDELVAALDNGARAAGPRLAGAATSQHWLPYAASLPKLRKELSARARAARTPGPAGVFRGVPRLDHAVVAMRASNWQAGGALPTTGDNLAVAERSWTHRLVPDFAGAEELAMRSSNPMLLTAVYIAKNEEEFIGNSILNVRNHADEVIVYDTGSTDRTVEIAREAGATVINGFWNDHFAEARNRAMDYANGRYVVTVDPDERLVGGAQLREILQSQEPEVINLSLLEGQLDGSSKRIAISRRIWLRGRRLYINALHEQPVIPGETYPTTAINELSEPEGTGILHLGNVRRAEGKNPRNERIALIEVDAAREFGPGPAASFAIYNAARSVRDDDKRLQLALEAATVGGHSHIALQPIHLALQVEKGRLSDSEFESLLARLAVSDPSNGWLPALRVGRARYKDDHEQVIEQAALVTPGTMSGLSVNFALVAAAAAASARHLGRTELALEFVSRGLADGAVAASLEDIVMWCDEVGVDLASVLEPATRPALRVLADLAAGIDDAYLAIPLLDWIVERSPDDSMVIKAGSYRAVHDSDVQGALAWTLHAMAAGVDVNPIAAVAADPTRTMPERLMAAALDVELHPGDSDAAAALRDLLRQVPEVEQSGIVEDLIEIAPSTRDLLVG